MARLAAGCRKKENGRIEKRFVINGKRYSVSGKTSRECVDKEKKVREQVAKLAYTSNSEITLSEYYAEWERDRENVVKRSTIQRFRSRFRCHIEPVLGQCKVTEIEKRQVKQLQHELAKTKHPNTVNCIIISLQTLLNGAIEDQIITVNPAANVKALRTDGEVKATDSIHRALEVKEQELFLGDLKDNDEYLYEFTYFSLCTGIRIMEVNALTWEDIDYKKNVIHVTKTMSFDEDKHEYTVTSPKSRTSNRDIPLTSVTKRILEKQKEKDFMFRGGNSLAKGSRIFATPTGKVIQSTPFRYLVERSLKRIEQNHGVKIEPFTHHCMRATFATRYLENGGNIQTLKVLLGHASLKMTADLYAHVLEDTKQKEMDMIAEAFGSVAAI